MLTAGVGISNAQWLEMATRLKGLTTGFLNIGKSIWKVPNIFFFQFNQAIECFHTGSKCEPIKCCGGKMTNVLHQYNHATRQVVCGAIPSVIIGTLCANVYQF